jgi:5-bromo-4-chloroindolyl phosphate hydrolysis protein
MGSNEIDIITYFDAKFNALKEYFDERFKNSDEKFCTERDSTKSEIVSIHNELKEHDKRIDSLEKTEGNKARNLVQSIKENALKFVVPTLIVLVVFLLGNGTLASLIGIK